MPQNLFITQQLKELYGERTDMLNLRQSLSLKMLQYANLKSFVKDYKTGGYDFAVSNFSTHVPDDPKTTYNDTQRALEKIKKLCEDKYHTTLAGSRDFDITSKHEGIKGEIRKLFVKMGIADQERESIDNDIDRLKGVQQAESNDLALGLR